MKQDFFVASYVQNKGSVHKACRDVGISRQTYVKWAADDVFVAKLNFAKEVWVEELRKVAYEIAVGGDKEMLKFMLTAYQPQEFDAGLRKQALANKGNLDILGQMTRQMTEEEVTKALKDDPFVDYTDKEFWEKAEKQ